MEAQNIELDLDETVFDDKLEDLNVELKNWQQDRNESQKGVDRQFTAENARGKQKHLYPILSF